MPIIGRPSDKFYLSKIRSTELYTYIYTTEDILAQLKSYIKVERYGERDGKEYDNCAYYISSLRENAQTFAQKIRGHWPIENQLHWVKDVIFKEDTLPLTDFQAVSNFSIIQTIALNLFRSL
ncbi:MAG: ISAs1 family transposase, partial [Microcystis aeruginosa W11-06]|nr:ISAs1 family transposase [Microcystis aeruginosa W11-03]NCR95417.1 ISAs1 family transposase [Microcystis aeruginosa W11-06]